MQDGCAGASDHMATISIRISDPARLTTTEAHGLSVWARVTRVVRNAWCVVNGGHYKVLHTEPDRMALRCVACGHMSPGWSVMKWLR